MRRPISSSARGPSTCPFLLIHQAIYFTSYLKSGIRDP